MCQICAKDREGKPTALPLFFWRAACEIKLDAAERLVARLLGAEVLRGNSRYVEDRWMRRRHSGQGKRC